MSGGQKFKKVLLVFVFAIQAIWPIDAQETQKLDENCTINILNRTIQVQPDGGWALPNIPANMGRIRARATCIQDGITITGQSAYFTVGPNGITDVGQIFFEQTDPIPTSLTFIPSGTIILENTGTTIPLQVTATYPDGSTTDVTNLESGINYSSTNPAIVTINADGLVSAVDVGSALITARKDGAVTVKQITVTVGGDSDEDGLPNDYEIANGLNPQDPVDAFEDKDRDGLTVLEEFNSGTNPQRKDTDGDELSDGEEVKGIQTGGKTFTSNPLIVDTDGDGLSDGVEVRVGTDPEDENDSNFSTALVSLEVLPNNPVITFNTIFTEASIQLQVIGHLINGDQLDLTSTDLGTTYVSSNPTIANFGVNDGRIFAGQSGVTEITVQNGGYEAVVHVTVTSFSPRPLTYINLPGTPHNVQVAGNYAYVVAADPGMHVVDVSDPSSPFLVATIDTPGSAEDVILDKTYAYIADGTGGLQIINVSDPLNPVLTASLATNGNTKDLVIENNTLFIANGSNILSVDITAPSQPVILGAFTEVSDVKGIDIRNGQMVAVGNNTLLVIDANNPIEMILQSSVNIEVSQDVIFDGRYAHVAARTNGYQAYDLNDPSTPVHVGTLRDFYPVDLVMQDGLIFLAEIFFVSAIPYVNITDPTTPLYQGFIDLSQFGDDDGNGIDVSQNNIYMTSVVGKLYIAQYRFLEDNGTTAPLVNWLSPQSDITWIEGEIEGDQEFAIEVEASDDVHVAVVNFLVNGEIVAVDAAAPYNFDYTFSSGTNGVTLQVSAVDLSGNIGESVPLVIQVVPDGGTTVEGKLVDIAGIPVIGGEVICDGVSGTTNIDGTFSIPNVSSTLQTVECQANYKNRYNMDLTALSVSIPPVRNGITNVGTFTAPSAQWVTPSDNTPWITGEQESILLEIESLENQPLNSVSFLIDGENIHTDDQSPFQFEYTIPEDKSRFTLGALVADSNNYIGEAPYLTITMIADPGTAVEGQILDAAGKPVAEANVICQGISGVTDTNGYFAISGLSTISGDIQCQATYTNPYGAILSAQSPLTSPNRDEVTDVGTFSPPVNLPTVTWLNPTGIVTWIENDSVTLKIASTADVSVVSVSFIINGEVLHVDSAAPFEYDYTVIAGTDSVTIAALAKDVTGNEGQAIPQEISIIPDPNTIVEGKVVDIQGNPVAQAVVTCLETSMHTEEDGTFSMPEIPTISGDIQCQAAFNNPYGELLTAQSLMLSPVAGGVTNAGTLQPLGTAPQVTWLQPTSGTSWIVGESVVMEIKAVADVYVDTVSFLIDEVIAHSSNTAPYQFEYTVPDSVDELKLSATATDLANQTGQSAILTIPVIPDPGTTVTGIVLNANQIPVSGAQITCLGVEGVTNSQGKFSIAGVPTIAGNVQCTATYNGLDGEVTSQSISLAPVREGTTAVGEMVSPGTIVVGKVLDVVGIPVEGRMVTCVDVSAATAADGSFSLGLSVDSNQIQCQTAYTDPNGVTHTVQSVSISQVRGNVTDIGVLTVPDPGTIVKGKVIDAAGRPVKDAQVTCLGGAGTTLDNGVFSIAGVETASGNIQCDASFSNPYGKTLSAQSNSLTPVRDGITDMGTFTPPVTPPQVSWTYPSAGTTLVEADPVTVEVNATADVFVASVSFSLDGVHLLTDEVPSYKATTTVPQGKSSITFHASAVDLAGYQGQVSRSFSVIPDPGTTVEGKVVDIANSPINGANVTCLGKSGITSPDGMFSITSVSTTSGNISCEATYSSPYGKQLTATSDSVAPVRSGTTSIGTFSPPVSLPTVTINPIGNKSVWFAGEIISLQVEATADVIVKEIRFLLNNEVISTVNAASHQFTYHLPDLSNTTSFVFSAQAIDIANNTGMSPELTIAVDPDPGTSIRGIVTNSQGQGWDGVQVECLGKVGQTFGGGVFVIAGLSTTSGNFSCQLTYDNPHGDDLSFQSEQITPVREGSVDLGSIQLDPGTTVTGKIMDISGNPLSGATVNCLNISTQTNSSGEFSIPGFSSVAGNIQCQSTYSAYGITLTAQSSSIAPVRGAVTNVGTFSAQSAPPTVTWLSPSGPITEKESATLRVHVDSSINMGFVRFFVNGSEVNNDNTPPYEFTFTVQHRGTLALKAIATDSAGRSVEATHSVTVLPPPETTVTGQVLDNEGTPVTWVKITCGGLSDAPNINGEFSIPGVSTLSGNIQCVARYDRHGIQAEAHSPSLVPVRGGITHAGILTLPITLPKSCVEYQQKVGRSAACNSNTDIGYYWAVGPKTVSYWGGMEHSGNELPCNENQLGQTGMTAAYFTETEWRTVYTSWFSNGSGNDNCDNYCGGYTVTCRKQ